MVETPQPEFDLTRRQPAFAALDLGTNNCRLLIGTPTSSGFRVIDSFSRIVRLGEGLQTTGRLNAPAMDRTIEALKACSDRMARRPIKAMRAIATEACRRAANVGEFLMRVRTETGIRFDVISAREEAELALESCAPLLAGAGRRALLFDIGGGSTEVAWVRLGAHAPELVGYDSLPIGVVTLSERYGASAFTPAGFEAMVDDVAARLAPFERVHCIAHEGRIGGVRMLRYRRPLVDGTLLSADAADHALTVLRGLGRDGLVLHPCVGEERADFVLPGCAVFEAIRRIWPANEVVVADRGLREGMLLRMMRNGGQPFAQRDSRAAAFSRTALPA